MIALGIGIILLVLKYFQLGPVAGWSWFIILAKSKNCLACHAPDRKLVGPAYRDIAKKYANDKNAENALVKKIREGGVGVWGPVPMPANPQVSAEEARTLAKWVLATR